MDDAQTQGSSDGRVHTGPLSAQDVEAQGRALGHIGHHRSLVKDLQTVGEDVKSVADCERVRGKR